MATRPEQLTAKTERICRAHLTESAKRNDLSAAMIRTPLANAAVRDWLESTARLVIISTGPDSQRLVDQLIAGVADVFREPNSADDVAEAMRRNFGPNKPVPPTTTIDKIDAQLAKLLDAFREQLTASMNETKAVGKRYRKDMAARN